MAGRRTAADGLTVFTSRHGSATRDEFWRVVAGIVICIVILFGFAVIFRWL